MARSGSDVKECWYSVLGVERTATPEEIRSAYKKVALKWHPDKIQQSGASEREREEATVRFQAIVQAYEVLSDPVERAWYDKYRNEILSSGSTSKDFEFNVFSFFSPSAFFGFGDKGKGFYKVYSGVFVNIHKKEQAFAKAYGMGPMGEAPAMGSPNSPNSEVEEFYKYWTGFTTVKDFSWCDEYQVSQGPNRKVRRLMEEENAKIRKKKRREFNDAVRDLATFVKKRDKRWLERQVELQRLQKEKDRQFLLRKQELQQQKIAKAWAVQEQEWTKAPKIDEEDDVLEDVNEGSYTWKSGNKAKADDEHVQEFYCIICSKRFLSEKQWENHEKSKKHIERAAALKESFLEEDEHIGVTVTGVNLEGDVHESLEDHRRRTASDLENATTMNYQGAEESAESSRQESSASKSRSEDLHKKPFPLESKSVRVKQKEAQKNSDDSEEDETETPEDDEEAMLAAMMNTFKSRLAVPPAEFVGPRDVDVHEVSDVSEERSDSGSSSDSGGRNTVNDNDEKKSGGGNAVEEDDEDNSGGGNAVEDDDEDNSGGGEAVDDDDEESLLASMLKSNRSQGRFPSDEQKGIKNPGEAEVRNLEAGSTPADEDEITPKGNIGKRNSRRKSKAEMRHMAAELRHSDLLQELSSVPSGNSAGEKDGTQSVASLSVEDSDNNQSTSNQKKKQSQRGQKGKKTMGVTKAANTCDTCGEDFGSRTQLFRHISSTNHGTLKSK